MSDKNVCNLCEKSYKRKFSLKRHYHNLHPGVAYDFTESKKFYNLRGDLKCSICQSSFSHYNDFSDHLFNVHDILLKSQHLIFQSDTEFNNWKKSVECLGNVSYVKPRGARLSSVGKVEYFQCHRSGNYKNKISNRQRELKIQGSSKIDAFCPSKIKAVYNNDGIVTVDYCETHVGHKLELSRLNFSRNEFIKLKSEIGSKRPFEIVLDVMEASIDSDIEKRGNYAGEFPLPSESLPLSDDATSIDDWVVKESAENKENRIIFYKPKGMNMPEYPHLNDEDFVLCVMNEAQAQILRKYSSDCICIDSFHGTNAYSFEMLVLVVFDDLQQGIPCAFYFSNRSDHVGIETFLTAVKEKIGILSAVVIMTDLRDSFYKSWRNVMGDCQERLFCTWYVLQAWKKRINQIKNDVKRNETYKKMFTLHNEPSETAFEYILPVTVKELCEDTETKDFGQFLEDNFINNCKSWAHCYRRNFGVNKNLDLERLHCIFKHYYLKGKMLNRFDVTVHNVIQFNNRKHLDRSIALENGEVRNRLRDIRSRHKRSLTLSIKDVVPSSCNTWNVFTSSAFQVYSVSLNDASCDCSLNCRFCKACIHKFNCTCIDACLKFNLCKHIHLVCRMLQSVVSMEIDELTFDVVNEEIVQSDITFNLLIEEENEKGDVGDDIFANKISNSFDIESSKQEIGDQFLSLLNEVNSLDEVEVFKKTMKYLEAQLLTLNNEETLSSGSTHKNNLNESKKELDSDL